MAESPGASNCMDERDEPQRPVIKKSLPLLFRRFRISRESGIPLISLF